MMTKEYKLDARLYWRESTGEWVMEISGVINDTSFSSRHAQPANIPPEDVPMLPTLYAVVRKAEDHAGLMRDLMLESDGVAGWHLNGDLAPWSELLEGPLTTLVDLELSLEQNPK